MDSNEDAVDKVLDQMQDKNSDKEFVDGLVILEKLIAKYILFYCSVIAQPFEHKYRTVKTTNNTIKTKVMNLKQIEELLLQLGYVPEGGELYVLKDERVGDFLEGAPAIDYRRRLMVAKGTSNEAYEKEKNLILIHKENRRQQAAKDREIQRMKDKCAADKQERKHMKVDQTQSNQLKFGANSNTFKDIGVDLCAKKGG